MFNLAPFQMPDSRQDRLDDPAAFAGIYAGHARGVHASAMAVLHDHARAQDVVQDVFLRLWRRPDAFDPGRGGLGTYLRLMARSRALDVRRETRATTRVGERLGRLTERTAPVPQGATAAVERGEVRTAIGRLPPGQREAVVLTYWGGLTAAEIARHADVPLGTAKSRVRLGLLKLREAYATDAAAA
jgi:RNA polymerase sigma-70 factor (ECF subfamily)